MFFDLIITTVALFTLYRAFLHALEDYKIFSNLTILYKGKFYNLRLFIEAYSGNRENRTNILAAIVSLGLLIVELIKYWR